VAVQQPLLLLDDDLAAAAHPLTARGGLLQCGRQRLADVVAA